MPTKQEAEGGRASAITPDTSAVAAPQWTRHKPLAIVGDARQRAARILHNAACAYADQHFLLEHQLAAAHFDALAAGDVEVAEEALAARVAVGFDVG